MNFKKKELNHTLKIILPEHAQEHANSRVSAETNSGTMRILSCRLKN